MRSLPNIYPRAGLLLSEESVVIPETPPPVPVVSEKEIAELMHLPYEEAEAAPADEEAADEDEAADEALSDPPAPPAPPAEQTVTLTEREYRAALEEARRDAVRVEYTKEELEIRFAAELQELRQDAVRRAYHDALKERAGELQEAVTQVGALLDELVKRQTDYFDRYTNELKYLAIDIAAKVMMSRIADDDLYLSNLVMQTVSSVKAGKWLTVELSERLVNLVDFISAELSKPEYQGMANVVGVPASDDTCRVVTEDGTLVATVSTQLRNLRDAFQAAEREPAHP